MTDADLDRIATRARLARSWPPDATPADDTPALVAEVRRLRAELAETERTAHEVIDRLREQPAPPGDPPPPDDWVFLFRMGRHHLPPEVRARRLLKVADALGMRCLLVRCPTGEESAAAGDRL